MIKLFLICLLFHFGCSQWFGRKKPELQFDRVEVTNYTDEYVDKVKARVSKYNRTSYVINLEGFIKYPFGNEIRSLVELFAYQGNEYRRVGSKEFDHFCDIAKDYEQYYEESKAFCNVPDKLVCPIAPQFLVCKDFEYTPDKMPSIFMSAERWKAKGTIWIGDKLIIIGAVYFKVW